MTPDASPNRARLITVSAAAVATVLLVCGGVTAWIRQSTIWGEPDLVFRRHAAELREYGWRLETGRVRQDEHGEYAMPQFLIDRGASRVTKRGECFAVTFQFLPSDAVPMLWYCPGGTDTLPPEIAELRQRHRYFRFESISRQWSAVWWDN